MLSAGARLAEPGEFTKRAFLNGRIDLSQAEAVIDVIQSKNEYALKSSVRQLSGKLSEKIKGLRELVLNNVAYIEAALDDPEHISLDNYVNKLSIDVDKCVDNVDNLLKTCDNGRIAKEGIRTVILGKTNAGKSSLLNALAKEERAIVTDIEGTTRDTLEEQITIGGIQLNLMIRRVSVTRWILWKVSVWKKPRNLPRKQIWLFLSWTARVHSMKMIRISFH